MTSLALLASALTVGCSVWLLRGGTGVWDRKPKRREAEPQICCLCRNSIVLPAQPERTEIEVQRRPYEWTPEELREML